MNAVYRFSVFSLLSIGYVSVGINPNQVEDNEHNNKNDGTATWEPKKRPHIIFILTDDQGFNDIGYHNPSIQTPTLDKLAAEGVKLENYYVQPICTPSRSQLITGRYQIHTGLQHSIIRPRQPSCLPLDMDTLPQRLQQAGYATHMVGKWHLGFYRKACLPTRRGFDSYLGSLTGSVDYYTYGSCDGPGLCGYDLHEDESVARGYGGKYSTLLYTQRVRKILASHDPASQPLFLLISFQAVHTPLQSPKAYIYPYRDMANIARRKYAAMVSTVDEAVRNITYALRKYGFYRNSVLVFSTDNGAQPFTGGSNWPLRGRKGTYWEGGVRGVGFVHSPLLRQKRRVSKALLHITDWFPTLVGLAGGNVSQSKGLDGYDVWPTISEGKESPRLEILHNIDPLHRRSGQGTEPQPPVWDTTVQAAIRVGDWKLLTGDPGHGDWVPPQVLVTLPGSWWNLERDTNGATGKSVWLFNITGDPYERHDLSEKRPDMVKQLLARLAFYNRTAVPVRFPPDDHRANPDQHRGAWVPWVGEEEKEEEGSKGVYKKGRNKKKKKKKCKLCKLRSFFKNLNTRMMSNRI
ncbi:arylsulfatase I [Aplochiton taeniatus]